MAYLFDHVGLSQIVQGYENPPIEVRPDFAVFLRVKPLVQHGLDRNVISPNDALLAEHIATPAANLIAAKVR